MKLTMFHGRCLNVQQSVHDQCFPDGALLREAWEKNEYVRLTFRVSPIPEGEAEIFPQVLRSLTRLLERELLTVHGADHARIESVMKAPFEHTAECWSLRIIPLHPDLLESYDWYLLRYYLVTVESELYDRLKVAPL